jgi:tetratricopeptide (TPR) repeat protein
VSAGNTGHGGGRPRGEAIRPAEDYRPPGAGTEAAPPPGPPPGRSPLPRALVLLLLALLAAALILMLAAPEDSRPSRAPEAAAEAAAQRPGQAARSSEPAAPAGAEQVLARRQAMEAAAEAAGRRRQALREAAVARWAEQAFADADAIFARAEDARRQRDYARAEAAYREAAQAFEALQQRIPEALDAAIRAGREALQTGDREAALAAFDKALAIDADSEAAQRGRARAEVLDEVLAELERARQAEADNRLEAARAAYQAARDKDAHNAAAREGLQRVQARLAERRFREKMGQALAALEAGALDAAGEALDTAARLRPDAPEVADARRELRIRRRAQRIDDLEAQARRAAAEERWEQALAHYDAMLQIDETLERARRGREHAAERAQLDRRLQALLDDPQRLQREQAREAARALLQRARAIDDRGPRLRDQIARLNTALVKASTPVPVTLLSDGKTRVQIFHVGDLGRFERREIELTPGSYTVLGRCRGYRDERRELRVAIGENPELRIECEEPI